MRGQPFLVLEDVTIGFPTPTGGWSSAVDGLSLAVAEGERVGLVGESGSGKSLTALGCLGLVPEPGRIVGGQVTVDGRSVLSTAQDATNQLRGGQIGLVLQEASGALNPVYTVGYQLAETIAVHRKLGRPEQRREALELLTEVSVGDPDEIVAAYPHELSGGEAQRVMLALALAGRPQMLIADEPTSALDLVTQAQILTLLERFTRERGIGLLLISHDLAVIAEVVDRVVVMYAGQVVEDGPAESIFTAPLHPYTRLLLASIPGRRERRSTESVISPDLQPGETAEGCRFAHRCRIVQPLCGQSEPPLTPVGEDRLLRCPVVAVNHVGEPDERS
jgi:oligopeptide/dipeptide ABC transporter ATP-binding protein